MILFSLNIKGLNENLGKGRCQSDFYTLMFEDRYAFCQFRHPLILYYSYLPMLSDYSNIERLFLAHQKYIVDELYL